MKVILASKNPHKLTELSVILSQHGLRSRWNQNMGSISTWTRRARRLKKTRF